MEYREVVCRNCGHGMRIPEGASRIRCEYCDTEYFLSGADSKQREVRLPIREVRTAQLPDEASDDG